MATATSTLTDKATAGINSVVDTVERTQNNALQSTRKVVDSISGVIPELIENGPRTKIIDTAFDLTGKLMGASTDLTRKIVDVAVPSKAY